MWSSKFQKLWFMSDWVVMSLYQVATIEMLSNWNKWNMIVDILYKQRKWWENISSTDIIYWRTEVVCFHHSSSFKDVYSYCITACTLLLFFRAFPHICRWFKPRYRNPSAKRCLPSFWWNFVSISYFLS